MREQRLICPLTNGRRVLSRPPQVLPPSPVQCLGDAGLLRRRTRPHTQTDLHRTSDKQGRCLRHRTRGIALHRDRSCKYETTTMITATWLELRPEPSSSDNGTKHVQSWTTPPVLLTYHNIYSLCTDMVWNPLKRYLIFCFSAARIHTASKDYKHVLHGNIWTLSLLGGLFHLLCA